MLVTFVVDTSASMNQTTSTGMTLLDYAKSAVERFVKRVRDPSRRYQHHFMLVSCGCDNATANMQARNATSSNNIYSSSSLTGTPPWNGRVRVGWDQSTNKDAFLTELKNLRATDLSDIGASLKQAFELMNQIRLQFNWDNYGLGRTPWNTNVAVCVLLTDASMLSTMDGMIQDALTIPPSTMVGADLTMEPFRWDQRLFTVALKLSATAMPQRLPAASHTIPTDLLALSEATGGMLYMPTSKSSVEQSMDQIISKLKAGAVVKFRCDSSTNLNSNDVEIAVNEFPTTRNTLSPIPSGKEYCWPIPESFWLDRNTISLPPREAHPLLVFRRTTEGAVEAATNHTVLDTLKFPADNYLLEFPISPSPPRGQRWPVYVPNSLGDSRLGDPIGFLRVAPSVGSTSSSSSNVMLVLLPYNFPLLFSLLVEAARVYQASGQNIISTAGTWAFQAKAMPSSWRETFSTYLTAVPLYYYAPLKKALRKYNLHDMVPDVQDSGRSYQISNYLNRVRDQSITESENQNKANSRANRVELSTSRDLHSLSALPLAMKNKDSTNNEFSDPIVDAVGNLSVHDLLRLNQKSARAFFISTVQYPSHPLSLRSPLEFGPSNRALESEDDEKHQQPIDSMSDYESRLIKKEALRNPLSDPEPDEDTPAGLRRRQLCFNLGNPYKKNASKQQVSNVYQGEAADEAAALGGQSPKRQRTRKRSSQMKRDKKQTKRSHRPPNSPSFSSPSSPDSLSRSPNNSPVSSNSSTAASSPIHSESGDSTLSEGSIGSNYSIKAETAQLLGVPLRDGEAVFESSSEGDDKSFVRLVYGVLVENWEVWSNILRLVKARTTTKQEDEFIINALQSMKGGDVVVCTYIEQAIRHATEFKKHVLIGQLQKLQHKIETTQALADDDDSSGNVLH